MSNPLDTLRTLEQLYLAGFHDAVTDAALARIAASQVARDRAALRDLERDLGELEQRYKLSSEEFYRRWQTGDTDDSADFVEWSALYQMAREVRERLALLEERGTAR